MLSVVIQAGGESKRMGRDKGLVPFLGIPLIQRVIDRVRPIADELVITSNHPDDYKAFGLPVYPDLIPGKGALSGLFTALNIATCPLVAVVACDMAFVNIELLTIERDYLLVHSADGVVPLHEKGFEPFHAVYRRKTCLNWIKEEIEAGKMRADGWLRRAEIHYLSGDEVLRLDPEGLAFININTPEDLLQAQMRAVEVEKKQMIYQS